MKFSSKPLLLLTALFGLAASAVWADENPGDYLHTRTYFGILGTSVGVGNGGEFTGKNYSRVDDPYELTLIPALDRNFGFGGLFGHREEAYALEISYWQSSHLATFGPATLSGPSGSVYFSGTAQETAVYHSVNVDFKRYFLTELQIQPFVSLGVCFPWIDIPNAAANSTTNFGNATIAGLGLDLGVGAEYYLNPNISFTAGAYQRWASFDEFNGLVGQYRQIGSLPSDDGSGLTFAVGATVGFQ